MTLFLTQAGEVQEPNTNFLSCLNSVCTTQINIPMAKVSLMAKVKINGTGTYIHSTAAAKLHQSYPTLCDPIDSSPPGSPIPGLLQARILEWVAISFSSGSKWKVKMKSLSQSNSSRPHGLDYQAPLSMGFPRQEYWSGLPLPSPIYSWELLKISLKIKGAYA